MTRRSRDKRTTDDSDENIRNGHISSLYSHRACKDSRNDSEESERENNEVIEIDSDSQDEELNSCVTNNNDNSKTEQNNNEDSDQESTSSDVVVISDDYQKIHEEIERLSRIDSKVILRPEEKVSNKNFKIHTLLGTGAYGKVFLVEKLDGKDKGHLYAMKVLEKNKVTQKKKTTEHTRTEREVLEKVINCPFLATLYYAFQTAEKLYLVMEFVQGGELFSHLYKSENFKEDHVRFYIAEIIVALEQLHKFNIIYRDIKLENILLDAEGHIIITDFGLSKELTDGMRAMSYCGTIEYMAPEIVNPHGGGHDLNVDWWSVGVLIIELLSGQSPFSREGEDSNQQLISERIQRQPPNIPANIGKDAKDLILKLLEKDPRKRLGFRRDADELKEHKFFRNIDWEVLKEKRYYAPMKPQVNSKLDVSQFSEDFTNQPAVDGPAESGPLTAHNGHNFFRGYSFVAPHLRKQTELDVNVNIQEMNLTDHPPEMNQPLLKEVFQSKKSSPFFKKYSISSEPPIGDGTYSLCMNCVLRSTKEKFAVKIMKIDHDASQEIQALEKCQGHQNVVKLIETMHDKKFRYIVFELLSGGELFSRIQESGYLSETAARFYFQQIVDAVSFIHSKGFIHKDLKPENILFVEDCKDSFLRIVDFGFAQKKGSESLPCFTLDYAAPESLVKGETKTSRDLWSLGVILYTMLCGNTPFKPLSSRITDQVERNFRVQITENIRKGNFNTENIRWKEISLEAKDLIGKLIKVAEYERISLEELNSHPWMLQKITKNESTTSLPSSFQRTDSEETVILDEEENLHKTDETRSNDDNSSSGIVILDRNNGSSSHASLEENESVQHEEIAITYPLLLDEQNEPENLSLKEHKVEHEEIPTSQNLEDDVIVIYQNKADFDESRESDLFSQESINNEEQPLSLRKLSNTSVRSDFLGFPAWLDDNNFPFFGFPKNDALKSSEQLLFDKYGTLLAYHEQKPPQNQTRRGKKRKIFEEVLPQSYEQRETRKSKRIAIDNISKQMKPEVIVHEKKPATRRGQTTLHKINLVTTNIMMKPEESLKVDEGKKRSRQSRVEQSIKLVIQEKDTKNDKLKSKRGRPPKSAKNSVKENEKVSSASTRSKIKCQVKTEAFHNNASSSTKIDKKPHSAQQQQLRTIIEKPLEQFTVPRAKRQRRQETFIQIKPEQPQAQPAVIISYQQPTPPQQRQEPTYFSNRFIEHMNYIRSRYVENKEHPSYIGRVPKEEAKERSAIQVTTNFD